MSSIENTVFLSYRRIGGSGWALHISKYLAQRGYDVFVDYASVASGDFEQVILENIRTRAHFLVLLTPYAVERINQPGDWLCREIEAALQHRRNIVPLMLEGFDFATPSIATHLTGTLAPLKSYNGVSVPLDYFEPAMDRLIAKHLNVALDQVRHPPSVMAAEAAKTQQVAFRTAPVVTVEELTAEHWVERGFDATDLNMKLVCYGEAIRLKPDFVEAYHNRANARRENGDPAGALVDFAEVVRLMRDIPGDFYDSRALARQDMGDMDGALEDFAEAIRLTPDYAQAYYNRAIARRSRNDLDGALADYTEAIRLNPGYAAAYVNRGNARRSKTDVAGALDDFTEAIRLKPDYALAYNNRGPARRDTGDLDGALADFTEAIRLQPDFAPAYRNRGTARSEQGDYSAAIADYEKYLNLGGGLLNGDQSAVEGIIRDLRKRL